MAINCYETSLPVEVCVDGPVGNGQTADMAVFITDWAGVADQGLAGSVSNWDGSTVVFSSWTYSSFGGCNEVSGTIAVTLIGANQVQVTVEIQVNDCPSGNIYSACGDAGPHTFTDTRIITMTGAACSSTATV